MCRSVHCRASYYSLTNTNPLRLINFSILNFFFFLVENRNGAATPCHNAGHQCHNSVQGNNASTMLCNLSATRFPYHSNKSANVKLNTVCMLLLLLRVPFVNILKRLSLFKRICWLEIIKFRSKTCGNIL